jgi:predicted metal-binding transcription factor (methanogenesis marker protein 9)
MRIIPILTKIPANSRKYMKLKKDLKKEILNLVNIITTGKK